MNEGMSSTDFIENMIFSHSNSNTFCEYGNTSPGSGRAAGGRLRISNTRFHYQRENKHFENIT